MTGCHWETRVYWNYIFISEYHASTASIDEFHWSSYSYRIGSGGIYFCKFIRPLLAYFFSTHCRSDDVFSVKLCLSGYYPETWLTVFFIRFICFYLFPALDAWASLKISQFGIYNITFMNWTTGIATEPPPIAVRFQQWPHFCSITYF